MVQFDLLLIGGYHGSGLSRCGSQTLREAGYRRIAFKKEIIARENSLGTDILAYLLVNLPRVAAIACTEW